jgi:hypothetical protein
MIWYELGKSILVPLTTSLYVPGTLADPDNVIVDVGTGFYVEKVGLQFPIPGRGRGADLNYRARRMLRSSMRLRWRSSGRILRIWKA